MENYSMIKKNKIVVHTTVQVNLENSIVNEKRQPQKTMYHMIPYRYIIMCNNDR